MSRLLIVDDEANIRNVVKEYAEFEEYEVDEAANGMEAVEKCRNEDYDLIIMDVMMPKLDGYSASKEIKKHKNIPIIMLSARSEEYDKLFGFEIGADDYVVKPFSPKELMARVKAVLSRSRQNAALPPIEERMMFGGLEIDMAGREVFVDGSKVSREQLLEAVWGYDFFGDDRTVDTHIKMLRGSLGKYRSYIVTLRSIGYKFDAEAT